MQLIDLIDLPWPEHPWETAHKIPWHERGFSERMLAFHLDDRHDLASRRGSIIDEHLRWLHETLLGGTPARILDLGCGPGRYSVPLAALGHEVVGVDVGPASIDHARKVAEEQGVTVDHRLGDIRTADLGSGYDLVMLVYGELDAFSPDDAEVILTRAREALAPGGRVVIEVHAKSLVESLGRVEPRWSAAPHGLFSYDPHLVLEASRWYEEAQAVLTRYFVVDASDGSVTLHTSAHQAYPDGGHAALLARSGLTVSTTLPSLGGPEGTPSQGLFVLVATVS